MANNVVSKYFLQETEIAYHRGRFVRQSNGPIMEVYKIQSKDIGLGLIIL